MKGKKGKNKRSVDSSGGDGGQTAVQAMIAQQLAKIRHEKEARANGVSPTAAIAAAIAATPAIDLKSAQQKEKEREKKKNAKKRKKVQHYQMPTLAQLAELGRPPDNIGGEGVSNKKKRKGQQAAVAPRSSAIPKPTLVKFKETAVRAGT